MAMDLDIEWIWLGHAKVCISTIVRGHLEIDDFRAMPRRIGEALLSINEPVVIDLRQATWSVSGKDFHLIVAAFAEARLGVEHKVALVCGRDIEQFGELVYIASGVSNRCLKVRAFYDFDASIKWLANQWDDV